MSKHKKLVDRLKGRPKDFTWHELTTLLGGFGYQVAEGDGSRRKFVNEQTGVVICLHKPHPGNALKRYQIDDVVEHLKGEGLL
jgi:hypothetical protein